MRTNNRLIHPVLNVLIGGRESGTRPSSFSLITDASFPSVTACLRFPADAGIGKPGEAVSARLVQSGEHQLLFTGEIYSAGIHGGYRDLALTDGYKKLCDTAVIAAYRKETAKVILEDTLALAGITDTAVTVPAVELARFSTEKISAERCLTLLIQALAEHGHAGLRFFFDAENTFHFGTEHDTGKNDGPAFAFVSGKNILKTGDGFIEVLPLPIRHSQTVIVDGKKMNPCRTELTVSGRRSRLTLWLEAV